MHPVYLQSDCSGAEGAFYGLKAVHPQVVLISSCLVMDFMVKPFGAISLINWIKLFFLVSL